MMEQIAIENTETVVTMESIMTVKGMKNIVKFDEMRLTWKKISIDPGTTMTNIPIRDIISVDMKDSGDFRGGNARYFTSPSPDDRSRQDTLDLKISIKGNTFEVHYVIPIENNKLQIASEIFGHDDCEVAFRWVKELNMLIKKKEQENMLIFVNPIGGRGNGLKIYYDILRPIIEKRKVSSETFITERANHARDVLMNRGLNNVDSIICVGGDGTVAEIVNALIDKSILQQNMDVTNPDFVIPRISVKLGIIPSGSTNTIAYSIYGTDDQMTASIHAIMDTWSEIDLCSVHKDNQYTRSIVSVVGCGFLGDVLKGSENLRWMGPARYEFLGTKMILSGKSYRAVVSWNASEDGIEKKAKKCTRVGCIQCNETRDSTTSHEGEEWVTTKGKYFMINGANINCICAKSKNGLAPYCHNGDGYLNLMLVKKINIFQRLWLLMTLARRGTTVNDLPYVEMYRTTKFRLDIPESEKNCSDLLKLKAWNCDGEVLTANTISVQSNRKAIKVLCRRDYY